MSETSQSLGCKSVISNHIRNSYQILLATLSPSKQTCFTKPSQEILDKQNNSPHKCPFKNAELS